MTEEKEEQYFPEYEPEQTFPAQELPPEMPAECPLVTDSYEEQYSDEYPDEYGEQPQEVYADPFEEPYIENYGNPVEGVYEEYGGNDEESYVQPYEEIYEEAYEDASDEDMLIPLTAPYRINYDLHEEAYRTYQKRFIFPKNRFLQLILLLLAVDFGWHGAKNPDEPMYYMLLIICVSLMMILWYNPRKMRRNVLDMVRTYQEDAYQFSMNEECITFRMVSEEGIPDQEPSVLYYTKALRVIEKQDFFLICEGRKLYYVLPKYALYDNQAIVVRETFEENLGRRFRSKI